MSTRDYLPDDSLELFSDEIIDELLASEAKESGNCPSGTPKLDSNYAGYMELDGAKKDGGCNIVNVEGGISKELGCCNLYHPKDGAERFNCGNCKYEE